MNIPDAGDPKSKIFPKRNLCERQLDATNGKLHTMKL